MKKSYTIGQHEVLFEPSTHQYTVDGINVPSVTQIIDEMLGKPYKNVDPEILEIAAKKGTNLHDMIEYYERFGRKTFHVEMQGYLALKNQYQINVLKSEQIVIIYDGEIPIAAGRFDMVVNSPYMEGQGIVDVKRMAHLDMKRLTLQLNLYKLGYEQTYKEKIQYLKCLHIRNRHKDYIDIPIDSKLVSNVINTHLKDHPIDYTLYY